jgi:hypothetical protein
MRKFASGAIVAISLFVLVSRALSEFTNSKLEGLLLRAEAKCPGLPFGSTSGGPDYIDIAIDGALAVVAAVFIALTIRDLRRRRKSGYANDDSSEGAEGDDL